MQLLRPFPITLAVAVLLSATPGAAGAPGEPMPWLKPDNTSVYLTRATPPDCSQREPSDPQIPAWSRLQWSLGVGPVWRISDRTPPPAIVFVPQASYALLLDEGRCKPGDGALISNAWIRWSLAISADLAWRITDTDPIDARPALRLSRAKYHDGQLRVGTNWVPSSEVALTAGPTFEPTWSGAAVGVAGRFSALSLELRTAVRTESRGLEVMLLFGIIDVHGLWKLGADRT